MHYLFMIADLIDISAFPSMPASFSSDTPGEAWVWGDFFLVLQTNPVTVAKSLQKTLGISNADLPPMTYPYAMMVYYHQKKNPHGASHRPVLAVTLERMDYSAALAKFGGGKNALKELGIGGDDEEPPVCGLFYAKGRSNFGTFNLPVTPDNVRNYCFDRVRQSLSPQGEPFKIGTIEDVFGHPETGWPARQKPKGGKLGCLVFIAALGGSLGGLCVLLLSALH
jgi:hypothetical protein